MTERALSEDALLAGLRDIHLPAEAAGGLVADMAAAGAVACLLAVSVCAGLRLVSRRRTQAAVPSLKDQIDASRALPEAERRVLLLHLLKQRDPAAFAGLRPALYRPGSDLRSETIAAELARHA